MSNRVGFYTIVGFNILSVPIVYYTVYTGLEVLESLHNKEPQILFDNGLFYYLLITIFWLFFIIELLGYTKYIGRIKEWLAPAIIGWFGITLLLAILLPEILHQKFVSAGYHACDDPAEISRISKGENVIYTLSTCRQAIEVLRGESKASVN